MAEKTLDSITGCVKLKWESAHNLYAVIDISNIYRVVHIVPYHKGLETDNTYFLLNRFLFR